MGEGDREENDWTGMSSSASSSPLIASYLVLHILPLFQPSKYQFVVQPIKNPLCDCL